MLTDEQIQELEKPFRLEEHRFKGKTPYIMKDAIRHRLDKVVPGWSMTAPEFVMEMNDVIVFRGGMTICGDTRWATGTGTIQRYLKDKDTHEFIEQNPEAIARETVKAVKTADSDLLPRCASKWGIGDYLRNMTAAERGQVSDMNGLKKFLDGLNKPKPAASTGTPSTPATQPTPQQSVHWATNGGGQRINTKIKTLKLDPQYVLDHAEPGRKLTKLSDTTFTEEQFSARLDELALALLGQPSGGSTGADPKP